VFSFSQGEFGGAEKMCALPKIIAEVTAGGIFFPGGFLYYLDSRLVIFMRAPGRGKKMQPCRKYYMRCTHPPPFFFNVLLRKIRRGNIFGGFFFREDFLPSLMSGEEAVQGSPLRCERPTM
jgi:hypothetical protein